MPDTIANPFGATPPGTFADMPTLREVTRSIEVSGAPFAGRAAFFEELDTLAEHGTGLLAEEDHPAPFRQRAGLPSRMEQIARLRATIDDGRVAPEDELGRAHRVLAAVVQGETIPEEYLPASRTVGDPDRFAAWAESRAPLVWQQAAAALTELDRVRGLPILHRGSIHRDGVETFSDALGLRVLTGNLVDEHGVARPASRENARQQVIAMMRDMPAEQREQQAWELLDDIVVSYQTTEPRPNEAQQVMWTPEDLARASRVCAMLAAGEGVVLRREPESVWEAIIDSDEYEALLEARNTVVVGEWIDRAWAASPNWYLDVGAPRARWSDPIADADASIRMEAFTADRARAAEQAHTIAGGPAWARAINGYHPDGPVLYPPLPEIINLRALPIDDHREFQDQLHRFDQGRFTSDEQRQRTLDRILHAVRGGRFLTRRGEAWRAEQLLVVAHLDQPLHPLPPLGAAIHSQGRYEAWASVYQNTLAEQQRTAAQRARGITSDADYEHPRTRELEMLGEEHMRPDEDAALARVDEVIAKLIADPSQEQADEAMREVDDIAWPGGQDELMRHMVRELAHRVAAAEKLNETPSTATDLTAAVTAGIPARLDTVAADAQAFPTAAAPDPDAGSGLDTAAL